MTHPDRDAELETWLRASSSLHEQLARLDRSDPPEELDRIVLERARDAIRSPRAAEPMGRMRWALPVGLAATLILSFALLLQIGPSAVTTRSEPASVGQERSDAGTATTQSYESARDETAADPNVVSQPIEIAPPPASRVHAPASQARAAQSPQTKAASERAAALQKSLESEQPIAVSADVRKDADAWLAEIERLRAQGRTAEAERELTEFKRAYPQRGAVPAGAVTPDDR